MCTNPKSVDPVTNAFFDGTPHITRHESKVLHCTLHASIFCQWEICVGLCQFWAANLVVVAAAFAVTGVWICRKWYAVPPQYPQNASGQMRNDQEFCTELQTEIKNHL